MLNTIKAKIMSGLNMTQLGRDYFDTSNPIEIKQHNLQVYAGYKSAIRQHENGILLNIEVGGTSITTNNHQTKTGFF